MHTCVEVARESVTTSVKHPSIIHPHTEMRQGKLRVQYLVETDQNIGGIDVGSTLA